MSPERRPPTRVRGCKVVDSASVRVGCVMAVMAVVMADSWPSCCA
jgi:hypothetical protein